jgi:hypothetical protein
MRMVDAPLRRAKVVNRTSGSRVSVARKESGHTSRDKAEGDRGVEVAVFLRPLKQECEPFGRLPLKKYDGP